MNGPQTPEQLQAELISSYPSFETLIRSVVDWDHVNSPDILEAFIRDDLGDPTNAEEFINNRHPRMSSLSQVLQGSSLSGYVGPFPDPIAAGYTIGGSITTQGGMRFANQASIEMMGPYDDPAATGTCFLQRYTGSWPQGRALVMSCASGEHFWRSYNPKFIPANYGIGGVSIKDTYQAGGVAFGVFLSTMPSEENAAVRIFRAATSGDTPSIVVDAIATATGTVIRLSHRKGDAGDAITTLITSRELPNLDVEIFFSWDTVTGNFDLRTRCYGESSWTDEGGVTGQTGVYGVGFLQPMCEPLTSHSAVVEHRFIHNELDRNAGGYTATDAMEVDYLWHVGSRTSSVTSDRAMIVFVNPCGMLPFGWSVRVKFEGLSNASDWVDLPYDGEMSALQFSMSGLSADTAYSYRFEVRDDFGVTQLTSEVYSFRTLPAEGSGLTYSFAVGSCMYGSGACHPYYHENDRLAAQAARHVFTVHSGDQFYESDDIAYITEERLQVESVLDFERCIMESYTDRALHAVMLAGAYENEPDDHQIINGADASMASGGSRSATLANNFTPAQNEYGASITLQDLWETGIAVFSTWFPNHSHEAGTTPYGDAKRYGLRKFGRTWYMKCDQRLERRYDSDEAMSSVQIAWIKARVDEFAASSARLLVMDSQGVWGPFAAKAFSGEPDGFSAVANADYRDLMDYIHTNVPTTKNVILIGGDAHVGYCISDLFVGVSGNIPATSALVANVVSSGITAGLFYSAQEVVGERVPTDGGTSFGSYSLGYHDPTEGFWPPASNNYLISTSALLFDIDEVIGTIRMRGWSGDTSSNTLDVTVNMNAES